MSRQIDGRRYWLVGASEGLGRALAHVLSAAGAELVLSARTGERLESLVAELPGPAEILPLDVQDVDACRRAAEIAQPLDGIVYVAGAYWPMGVDQWDTDRAVAMCDINLAGAVRVLGAALPQMRLRGQGHIVLTGSLAGYRGLPGALGYGASKAGLMSLAETLYCELRGTGIDVQLASPGYIRTRLTALNDFTMPAIMEPEVAAERVLAHIRGRRFACAFPRPFAWLFRLAQFLPEGLYFRLFSR